MTSFTQPANAHTPPPGVPLSSLPDLAPSGAAVLVKLAQIDPSPFNPRKEFPKDEIAELAESIKAQGLLEPLVVRVKPGKQAERYELMGGERRLRALKLIGADAAMCMVRNADDAAAIAIQIVENLQRQDLGPLEEAEAFAKLQAQDPKTWTAQAIAKAVGKTDRFVQQRIAIAGGLSAPLKKKFSEGEISVEIARTLAPLPAAVQSEIPTWAIQRNDAAEVRRLAFQICIPETAAKFDVALYKGDWIEGDKKRRYFADTAQFMKLQRPAAEKKLAEVQKDWPKAELVTAEQADNWHWADEQYLYSHSSVAQSQRNGDQPVRYYVPKEACTAIVWISLNGEIRKALGVCSKAAITAAANKRQQASSARYARPTARETPDHKKARQTFNTAVATAAAKQPPAILGRLTLLALLTGGCDLEEEQLKKLTPKALHGLAGRWVPDTTKAKLWTAIAALRADDVVDSIRKLLLADLPTWDDHEWQSKPPLMLAMAATLQVTLAKVEPKAAAPKAKAKRPAAKKKGGKK